jgi:hypothetical protein
MDKLMLMIEGGNSAVQTPEDVAHTLEKCAAKVREMEDLGEEQSFKILDRNGNTVGRVVFW